MNVKSFFNKIFNNLFINKKPLFSSSSDTICITLDRDSVCMGDDISDHKKQIFVKSNISLKSFIYKIQKEFIPKVSGLTAIWLLKINDKNICIFNQIGSLIISFDSEYEENADRNIEVYLKYYAQKELNEILTLLSE